MWRSRGAGLRWWLAKLAGDVAVIRVGGATEVEVKERKDRVEDAMHATRAAVEEGILPGGGVALLRAVKALGKLKTENHDPKTGIDIVRKALSTPARQIAVKCWRGWIDRRRHGQNVLHRTEMEQCFLIRLATHADGRILVLDAAIASRISENDSYGYGYDAQEGEYGDWRPPSTAHRSSRRGSPKYGVDRGR